MQCKVSPKLALEIKALVFSGCSQTEIAKQFNLNQSTVSRVVRNETGQHVPDFDPKLSRIYHNMIQRCYNPKNTNYKNYGARGIKVCSRWRESYHAFKADMGPRPSRYGIERINNDGDYEPGNCLWAPPWTQARNRRTNHWITIKGETRIMEDWAKKRKISPVTISSRIRRGWNPSKAVMLPPNKRTLKITTRKQ
jgi:hypothetical protein